MPRMIDIRFVLVEPQRPVNVGAAARALKTMGHQSLWLVGASQVAHSEEAHWVAHGANDILDNAHLVEHLDDALADCQLVIATTARQRGVHRRYHSPAAICERLQRNDGELSRVAVLFGCESGGLSNEALARADLWSEIPMAVTYPSLNLAQAVMVYAYELRTLAGVSTATSVGANSSSLAHLRQRIDALLVGSAGEHDQVLHDWLHDQTAQLNNRDIGLFNTLLNNILAKGNAADNNNR